jgi:2-methylcitrate dehydratase PrpD
MVDETLSEKLAGWGATLDLDHVPLDVIKAAELHVLDTVGCLLAGARLEPGKLAYELAAIIGPAGSQPDATLFGSRARAAYLDAVQAMSVAAHCGEMDDIHGPAATCIGGMIVPALLASAEKFGGCGRRFLEAVIVGYETVARIGLAIDAPRLFARGWWPSTICGGVGVAAAGAKFLRWGAAEAANAIGIASLLSGGMITGGSEGATARHLGFGHAAQSGVLALVAAERGFAGPRSAFEDPRGFCLTLCTDPKWEYLGPSEPFHLPEVAFKPYPCARQLHAAVEAMLKLPLHELAVNEIVGIEVALPSQNAAMVNRATAAMKRAAMLGSGQYVMAVTAIRKTMDLRSFDDEFLHNDEVRTLMRKVTITADPGLDRYFPQNWPGRVAVKTADGEIHSNEIIVAKGEAGNPMSGEEVRGKFLSLAAPVLGEAKALTVVDEIQSLRERDSLAPLLAALRLAAVNS